MLEPLFQKSKAGMEKALEAFQKELSKMRTGRASLAVLDHVRVSYYGQMAPLNQVATLGVPEPRLITIVPWEPKMVAEIEKAIVKANLGFSPINDGKMVRLPIPPLTEERRKDLVKSMKHHGEEGRVSIRHARREAMDELKKLEKLVDDKDFLENWRTAKWLSKKLLIEHIEKEHRIKINMESLFDVHIKRFHEYKRQLFYSRQKTPNLFYKQVVNNRGPEAY